MMCSLGPVSHVGCPTGHFDIPIDLEIISVAGLSSPSQRKKKRKRERGVEGGMEGGEREPCQGGLGTNGTLGPPDSAGHFFRRLS
jgi:hypothetical protein